MSKLLFCLMGPTASGKTALACELVQHLPVEIISVDSAMVYRGMNIGTAKPDAETLRQAPHHLIDILDPLDSYSAANFCEDVARLSERILNQGKIPLLVGGTMMYFRSLQQGLSSLPEADESIRAQLLQQAQEHGWAYMHQELTRIDPVTATRIHPNDTQRIQRALEVYQLTKKPLSEFLSSGKEASAYRFVNFSLIPDDRAWLHQRIALRFEQMLAEGFINEVEELLQKWPLTLEHPSMRSVGYRQVLLYLQGEYDRQTLGEKGIAATRQVAKRQLTWLRHWPEMQFFAAENPASTAKIMAIMRQILDNLG
jgi:tRNA dimethylallyltransferase